MTMTKNKLIWAAAFAALVGLVLWMLTRKQPAADQPAAVAEKPATVAEKPAVADRPAAVVEKAAAPSPRAEIEPAPPVSAGETHPPTHPPPAVVIAARNKVGLAET